MLLARPRKRRWMTAAVVFALGCCSSRTEGIVGSTAQDESNPVQILARSLEQLTGAIGPLIAQQQQQQQQQHRQQQKSGDDNTRETGHEPSSQDSNDMASQSLSAGSMTTPPNHTASKSPSRPTPTATSGATGSAPDSTHPSHQQHERLIPSYEQWRKQILEKQNKPAEQLERKQRRRKPYQESTVDVAIGEDELGFPFSNLEGSQQRRDSTEQDASLARQLGDGPDLTKITTKETTWIKAEYAKDPKDRFNHASATCAASVVKANKDAKSITAILNEGKDSYMLYKCDTKDKYFVVELCEEILVDTFVLGNYEFFSSTFKEFVVSVNRYPPRDDGWTVLGHFLARNSRDAQVFKPAVPRLATYIRFDFMSHYGREFYCPVTLLRVYGATALEQLKQEEEEEKRQLMEQQRIREALLAEERAREAKEAEGQDSTEDGEAEDEYEGDEDGEEDEDEEDDDNNEDQSKEGAQATESCEVEINEPISSPTTVPTAPLYTIQDNELPPSDNHNIAQPPSAPQRDNHEFPGPPPSPDSTEETPVPFNSHDEHRKTKKEFVEEQATSVQDGQLMDHRLAPQDEEPTMRTGHHETPGATDHFPPLTPTSPASMQDEPEWHQGDLGIITIPSKVKPSYISKPNHKVAGTGQQIINAGGSMTGENAGGHPHPAPPSQESVYKNIVNRIKALELNASLSHQYLEEQSNIFNEVLAGLEDTSSQLVAHLNEANKRLESLGRKYDQLAYSFKAHLDIDSSRTKAEVKDLSSQLHALAAQVLFQRQLFVITILVLCAILAFFAVTRNTTMPYTIVQSPLGAKLMAISGHRRDRFLRRVHNNLTNPDLPNGPSPPVPIPALTSHRSSFSMFSSDRDKRGDEASESVYTPPMSPMSPMSPMPPISRPGGTQNLRFDNVHSPRAETAARRSRAGSLESMVASAQRLENSLHEGGGDVGNRQDDLSVAFDSQLNLTTPEQRSRETYDEYPNGTDHSCEEASPEPIASHTSSQFHNAERFQVSRTPYPTPKNSYAGVSGDGGTGGILDTSHRTLSFRQLDGDRVFRSESPSFQALPSSPRMMMDSSSSIMDAGHLSDADVAYLSRDMNVARIDSNSPTPMTPTMANEPRMVVSPTPSYPPSSYATCSGYSPRSSSTVRPSALRNETTVSLQSNATTEQGDEEGTQPRDDGEQERQGPITSLLQESAFDTEQCQQEQHGPSHFELSSLPSFHAADPHSSSAVPPAQRFLVESQKQSIVGLEQQAVEQDEDQGFVSDSVIEGSKSDILRSSDDEAMAESQQVLYRDERRRSVSMLGESDYRQSAGGALASSSRGSLPGSASLPTLLVRSTAATLDSASANAVAAKNADPSRSKRRNSLSFHRTPAAIPPHDVAHSKNKSVSGIVGLGLGLDVQERHRLQQQQGRRGSGEFLCIHSTSEPTLVPKPHVDKQDGWGGAKDKERKGEDDRDRHQGMEEEQDETVSIFKRSSSTSSSALSSAHRHGQNGGRNVDQDQGGEGDDEGSPVRDRWPATPTQPAS